MAFILRLYLVLLCSDLVQNQGQKQKQKQSQNPENSENATVTVSVAVLVSLEGSEVREQILRRSADYVVGRLNKEIVLEGYTVNYSFHDTRGHPGVAMMRMDEAREDGAVAYVGPPNDHTCKLVGHLVQEWNIPMVTYQCLTTLLSDRKVYGTVTRAVGTFMEIGRFIVAVMLHIKLYDAVMVLEKSSADTWQELVEELQNNSPEMRTHEAMVIDMDDRFTLKGHIQKIVEGACQVVLCMPASKAFQFLAEVTRQDIFSDERTFITVNLARAFRHYQLNDSFTGVLDVTIEGNETSEQFQDFMDYVNPCLENSTEFGNGTNPSGYDVHSSVFQNFRKYCRRFKDNKKELVWNVCGSCQRFNPDYLQRLGPMCQLARTRRTLPPDLCIHDDYSYYQSMADGALMADAFTLLVNAWRSNDTLLGTCPLGQCGGASDSDFLFKNITYTSTVVNNILSTTDLQGITGTIRMNSDGTRYLPLVLLNLQPTGFKVVGRTNYRAGTVEEMYQPVSNEILLPDYSEKSPNCGIEPPTNTSPVGLKFLWGTLTAIAVIAMLILIGIRTLAKRRKTDQTDTSAWIIPSSSLYASPVLAGKVGNIMGYSRRPVGEKSTGWSLKFADPDENPDLASQMSRESFHDVVTGHNFDKVAVLDGQMVAIKPVTKTNLVLTPALIAEVNKMLRLKHTNVNNLVGACVEPGNVCLVWGYCHKGSLRNVLDNTNIKLDWMFKLAFVTDIARGMSYLHSSPIQLHGKLKSTNVLVDNNWGCKISDIAMPNFTAGHQASDKPAKAYFRNLLWTAPELLRTNTGRFQGTKKGDVYAFAVIMHEVYYRSQPFGVKPGENAAGVIGRVVAGESPPYRPAVEVDEELGDEMHLAKIGLQDLMIMCWDEYPMFRLSFPILCSNLKNIQEAIGRTANLVDQMLVMVKQYTENLEQLVADRTEQLEEEKKKTEELLRKMLPQSVAEELKMGRPVVPETYASATLFFSDILGFSDIATHSTPLQVVNLLNDLYICFDNVIETYDVYKVETIADNYVVSSGLPIRNGKRHAAEIATLALDLLTKTLTFTIRHMPTRQLLLRIGIHTGSVVAGVVGKKMPRYCLFGDTVNYTSRLESNSKPLHIHVSPECKKCLDKLGGFHLKERGLVEMKGKGKILTYFLVSKDGFECVVPNLRPIAKELLGIDVKSDMSTSLTLPSEDMGASISDLPSRAIDFLTRLST